MRIVEGQMVKIEMVGAVKQFGDDHNPNCKKNSYREVDGGYSEHQLITPRNTMEYVNNRGELVRRKTKQVAVVGETVRIIELSNGWVIDFDPYSKNAIIDYVIIGVLIYLLLTAIV